MKKRILSVALALCLCISSQSVAHASQEDSLQQQDVPTEEITDGPDIGGDVNDDGQEDSSQQENVPTEETTDESDTSSDAVNDGQKDPSQQEQEDVLAEETTDGPVTSDDMITALQEDSSQQEQENVLTEKNAFEPVARDSTVPTPTEAYNAMIALKDQDAYKEGTTWTDYEPYSNSGYSWHGGTINGANISAVGCVAFAFILSDTAFGSLPNRMYASGAFSYEDIKVGDILRVNNDAHTVIVLVVSDAGVVVAEGNYNSTVHWGRTISKEDVMSSTSHYITRYPESYIPSDDPAANVSIGSGTLDGGLTWNLTQAGTLTISGSGAMPDFYSTGDQPWSDKSSQIQKVVIGNGVTSIGSCAFWNCGVLSAEIASSVTTIGNSAFRGSSIIAVTIPSSVKTIGDSAFRECQNLSSVTVSDGVETIVQNAFRSCTSLTSIALPASIGEVGDAAFFQCAAMTSATFAPGSKQVKLGDNLFTQCYWLMRVTLPSSIDRIGEGMFQNCGLLAGVEIPQGAESIGGSAFASSGVSVVVIPDSVTTIGIAAFSDCPLTDIYYTGTEAQWNSISKIGDTASTVSGATIHYNYIPADDSTTSPGNNSGNTSSGNNTGNTSSGNDTGNTSSGNDPDSSSGENASNNNKGSGSDEAESILMASSIINSGIKAVMETWKPTTLDEIKRYACMGKEAIRYTPSKDNAYQIEIENAMQGPMCFQSFEAVLGDYTIGRTYNIYVLSNTTYSTDEEIQFTIEIPSAIYREDREYKMICVTEGGKPILYNDLDNDPETITIKTNKFYAYALIYK